jgi:uncharacterized membrane protein (UPF0127 family)
MIRYLLLMVLIFFPMQSGGAGSAGSPQNQLSIHTATGTISFQVELAATQEDRQRGLMFREELQRNEGMLFVYHEDRRIVMWMKSTLISLDMLFITGAGRIVRIEANTEPLSLRAIPSRSPVRAVLELKGGTAEFFGIKPGDRVSHGGFQLRKRWGDHRDTMGRH